MKLTLTIGSQILILPGEIASQAIAIAEKAERWTKDWNGKMTKDEDQVITFSFLDESKLEPIVEPIQKLTAELATSSSRWYTEYTDHAETKKKLKDLEQRLESLKATACGE